jgi:Outer membrane protein beta-barrel domain
MKILPLSLRMIKRLLAMLLFVSGNVALAQLNNASQSELKKYNPKKIITRVELLAGLNFIYPKEKYDENRVAKFGYTFGMNLVHRLGKSAFDLNLKLGYEQKGWKSITYSPNTDFSPPITEKGVFNSTLNYMTLSIYTTYHPPLIKNMSIGIGGYFGYLNSLNLKSELYRSDTLVKNSYQSKLNPYTSFKKYDAGITILVRYDFKVEEKNLILRIESNIGQCNVNQPAISDKRNRTYCLILGVPIF